jgi:hypothetical protein
VIEVNFGWCGGGLTLDWVNLHDSSSNFHKNCTESNLAHQKATREVNATHAEAEKSLHFAECEIAAAKELCHKAVAEAHDKIIVEQVFVSTKAKAKLYMGRKFFVQFLHEVLCSNTKENILQTNMFIILRATKMIAQLRIASNVFMAVVVPMRWLAGKRKGVHEQSGSTTRLYNGEGQYLAAMFLHVVHTFYMFLNRGCYPIQWDRNWSRGIVLRVLAREKLERKYFLFKLTNE